MKSAPAMRLFASFKQSQGFADTPETKAIEGYLQQVGDKIAAHSKRKLHYTFSLDPHPGFRSAVAYPGGRIVVGGGALALMTHEDELAVVLGHEIAHVDLEQCAGRVVEAMQKHQSDGTSSTSFPSRNSAALTEKRGELAADREGIELAVAAGYSPQAAIELLEIYQFLSRDSKPAPRADAPSLEERIQQAKGEIKQNAWEKMTDEKPLLLP